LLFDSSKNAPLKFYVNFPKRTHTKTIRFLRKLEEVRATQRRAMLFHLLRVLQRFMQNECKTRPIAAPGQTPTSENEVEIVGGILWTRNIRPFVRETISQTYHSQFLFRIVLPADSPCNNSGNHPMRWQEWIEYVMNTEYRVPLIKCAVSRKISYNGRALLFRYEP